MIFAAPEWFFLVPVLVFVGWYWKNLRLWLPLRVLCLALVVIALARPQVRLLEAGLDLWVLVDRSKSAETDMARVLDEWETLIERGKGRNDRVRYLDFADIAVLRGESDSATFPGSGEYTRMSLAVENALNRMPNDRLARLLVLSDGYSTEPLDSLAEQLVKQKVPMDYRLTVSPELQDYQVSRLRARSRVQLGEPFVLEVEVRGQPDGEVPLQILRNDQVVLNTAIQVREGRTVERFTDRITRPGAHYYTARVRSQEDAKPGNNSAGTWIEIAAGPRIVLLTNYPDDPLGASLRRQGFVVEELTNPEAADVGRLTGAKAVIFHNVPANRVNAGLLDGLPFFVNSQGGGFLMVGGRYSFGTGGYFQSAVDPLLPVSMELREEHRRLATAMAIVMDRSGSMGAGVTGGRTKMDLANEGAANAVELLGASDVVAVYAVDSSPHEAVPMREVGPNRTEIIGRVRRITSGGGGIFVYTGLKQAWKVLKPIEIGQKHVILFSDAADSEEPGDYKKLLAEMTAAGATVSVIGLGTPSDPDAAFIKDVANRGKGRIFFTTDPNKLPTIFAQETVSVARSAFITETTPLIPLPGWLELAANSLDWPAQVESYNLCYARPEATVAAVTGDDYNSPLVAFWRRGSGRAAAVAFPLAGELSGTIRGWEQYGDFQQTLARWLMGDELPPGLSVRTAVDGEELTVELLYTQDWEERIAQRPPEIRVAGNTGPGERALTWERLEPGRFVARTRMGDEKALRGAINIGPYTVPFGPLAAQLNVEWQTDRDRLQELRRVAEISGGEERLDLSDAWITPERRDFQDIRHWFMIALIPLFLLEALSTRLGGFSWSGFAALRRIGLPLPQWLRTRKPREKKPKAKPEKRPEPQVAHALRQPAPEDSRPDTDEDKEKDEDGKPSPPPRPEQDRRSRFSRAKMKK